jgi:hypothetical protein
VKVQRLFPNPLITVPTVDREIGEEASIASSEESFVVGRERPMSSPPPPLTLLSLFQEKKENESVGLWFPSFFPVKKKEEGAPDPSTTGKEL